MIVNTDVDALYLHNLQRTAGLRQRQNLEKLSSGKKINQAADDPSGSAISLCMKAQIRGLDKAIHNIQDGISMLQTMDGGMSEVQELLQRMRDIGVRAANEAPNSIADMARLNDEMSMLTAEVERLAYATTFNTLPVLMGNPDGSASALIYFTTERDGNLEIYTMNSDGSNANNLTDAPGIEESPAWSPDGTQLAYVTGGEVWVMDYDGENPVQVTASGNPKEPPEWSPDGSKLLFSEKVGGKWSIYSMNADGSGLVELANDPAAHLMDPTWSPDGSQIALERQLVASNDVDIFVMDADGSNLNRVSVVGAGREINPVWSPDGTMVAYQNDTDKDVIVAQADASGTRVLPGAPGNSDDVGPTWSPDGKVIFESTIQRFGLGDFISNLYSVNPDGSGSTDLTNNVTPSRGYQNVNFSPNGSSMAYSEVSAGGNTRIMLADQDGSNPVELSAGWGDNDNVQGWAVPPPTPMVLQVGPDNGFNFRIELNFPDVRASSLGVGGVNVSTTAGAQSSIARIDAAISAVSDEREMVGTLETRLRHSTNDAQAQFINITAANSRIEDADMAEEFTDFTKNQILAMNTTQSLAQHSDSRLKQVFDMIKEMPE